MMSIQTLMRASARGERINYHELCTTFTNEIAALWMKQGYTLDQGDRFADQVKRAIGAATVFRQILGTPKENI